MSQYLASRIRAATNVVIREQTEIDTVQGNGRLQGVALKLVPIPSHFWGVLGAKHPLIKKNYDSRSEKALPYVNPRLLSVCA